MTAENEMKNREGDRKNREEDEEEFPEQQETDPVVKKRKRGDGSLFCFKALDVLHRMNR